MRTQRTAGSEIEPTILLLTNEQDISADWVVRELRRRKAPFVRLNTERLADGGVRIDPISRSWRVTYGGGRRADLSGVKAIWYRRPEPPQHPSLGELAPEERKVVVAQWRSVVDGICTLPGVRCLNDPCANGRAESKLWQLASAVSAGFIVPPTLVTNERSEAVAFADRFGGTAIVKGLDAPMIDDPIRPRFVYAQRISSTDLENTDAYEVAPYMLQQEVLDKVDVRVTVAGSRVLAAQTIGHSATLDWRASSRPAVWVEHKLPEDLERLCVRYTAGMGLGFGAIDLACTPSGYTFLEINPNGEWGWLQKTVGLRIAEAISDLLCEYSGA